MIMLTQNIDHQQQQLNVNSRLAISVKFCLHFTCQILTAAQTVACAEQINALPTKCEHYINSRRLKRKCDQIIGSEYLPPHSLWGIFQADTFSHTGRDSGWNSKRSKYTRRRKKGQVNRNSSNNEHEQQQQEKWTKTKTKRIY